ncbi:hypothetical protein ACFPC0_10825 [Streptomyces andamanensis]|uniref:Uncharacterized protein n=1 Tax=Streptomyces andamanensis TaxID=1565035 RepID=A0ABV8TCI6_9ACTN
MTDLRSLIREATACIRAALRRAANLIRQVADNISRAADAARTLTRALTSRPADRPAWASPYGPAPRRRTL